MAVFRAKQERAERKNLYTLEKESRVMALPILLNCHYSLSAKGKPWYRGGVLLSSVCFLRSLLMVANIAEVLYSCQTVGRKLYLDLAASSILPAEKIIVVK